MKTSISLFLSDILPHRRKLFHKIVKNKIFENYTPDQAFTLLKKSGINGIEICLPQYSTTTNDHILEAKKLMAKYNLPIFSVHQALRFFTKTKLAEIMRLFQIADMMNAKLVVLHMSTAQKQIFDPVYIAALHALEEKYGIKVTFENMEKYFGSIFYGHRWHEIKFPDLVKKTNFHITFDIVHLAQAGGDILTFFKKNKDRIINIHLSDYKYHALNNSLRPLRFKHLPLGKGELPIKAFLQLLHKENYQGLLTMEIHTDLQGIRESTEIINSQRSIVKKSSSRM